MWYREYQAPFIDPALLSVTGMRTHEAKGAVPDAGGGSVLEGTAKNGAALGGQKLQCWVTRNSACGEEAATPAPSRAS